MTFSIKLNPNLKRFARYYPNMLRALWFRDITWLDTIHLFNLFMESNSHKETIGVKLGTLSNQDGNASQNVVLYGTTEHSLPQKLSSEQMLFYRSAK